VYAGEKVAGHVEDMIVNTEEKVIAGFLLEKRNLGLHRRYFPFYGIAEIRKDRILVKEPSDIRTLKKAQKSKMIFAEDLIHREIVDNKGEFIGRAADLCFDPINGTVREIIISNGLLGDLWAGRKKLPVLSKVEFSDELIQINQDAREEIYGMDKGLKRWLRHNIPK
ncbi:MAG TPA: PRC-barrel domain-containing protein, partial [Clostridia bacterium]